ncbi:unnamed protein product, partial [Closterium sp. NIES-54]
MGQGQEEEVQQPVEGPREAQPSEEPRALARPTVNCSGSAPPSPRAWPSTPPAEDPPLSQANGIPHHHHARGDPSSPHCHRGEQAIRPAAGSAGESCAGAAATRAPARARENGGDAAVWRRGTRRLRYRRLVADAACGDDVDTGAGTSGTEAAGATGAPEAGAGGSATSPAGADATGATKGARGTGASAGAGGAAKGAAGPVLLMGSAGTRGGVFPATVVTGLGAGGRGGFVAMVTFSGPDGGLATTADQAATSSGDDSGAPAITIGGAGGSRRQEAARVRGQGHERYFLLVVDVYSRYTTVFPLHSKGEVPQVLIDWIRGARRQLSESFGSDLPVLRLHSDRGGEFSSDLLRAFYRSQGIRQTFTLPASPQKNGIAEHRIGMVMDVARTSMIHAASPHFLWPFAVRYAAHQINLQPRVSLLETTPTLRWTGKVGDASAFRVWGSRAFVRDTTADKLSSRAVPCVFLGFPPDAPGWQFYHPTSRRVLSSQDVTFDESVSYYRLFPYRTASPPPPAALPGTTYSP